MSFFPKDRIADGMVHSQFERMEKLERTIAGLIRADTKMEESVRFRLNLRIFRIEIRGKAADDDWQGALTEAWRALGHDI